jgi:hypothetical protein
LPEQLRSPDSFASRLKQLLAARKKHRLAEAEILGAPDSSDRAVCVLVMKLPDDGPLAVTAMNYGRDRTSVAIDLASIRGVSTELWKGQAAHDIVDAREVGLVSGTGRLTMRLAALSGRTVVLRARAPAAPELEHH